MKLSSAMLATFLICESAWAGEKLREYSWSALQAAGQVQIGEIIPVGSKNTEECLVIENRSGDHMAAQILTVDQPGITSAIYALRGSIKYEGIEGVGYLEMWSYFPGGGRYFSRSLAGSGVMGSLRGSSGWRETVLPFSATGTPDHPTRLVVNLVLPSKGRVWLSALKLYQYQTDEDPLEASGAWWTDRRGGLIGGFGGSLLGLLGALIGILCTLGRGRSFVIGLMAVLTVLGAAMTATGIYALARGQPYGVFFPLLLGGGLAAIIFGTLIPVARRRYAQTEMRKMAAADLT
jgi:hypothetical protein